MKKLLLITTILFIAAVVFAPAASAYCIKGTAKDMDARDAKIKGKSYLLLTDICEANGICWEWDSISRRIILRKNAREAAFLIGSEYYCVDGNVKKIPDAVEMENGSAYIPLKFAKYGLPDLFEVKTQKEKGPKANKSKSRDTVPVSDVPRNTGKQFKVAKIVLDAGHGGKDPGAISKSGIKEKDMVLDVTRRIRTALEDQGVDVIMTRDSDVFIPLEMRARIANEANADFFVSIHANASRSKWVKGFEVYYLSEATDDNARALAISENSVLDRQENCVDRHSKDIDAIVWDLELTENREISIELAGFICQEVTRILRSGDSSIKSAKFCVLKGANMPSVLVELSYLSNKTDEKNLKDSSYRQKLAEGVASGIMRYKDEYERTNGFSR